ncbi:peroxisomal membrane protein 11B [Vespa velutina]|uniref:peroxisomal membrane protein 11B n=1 Tax=Vespa velutina TaxID=202808 RepID=UPI001FB2E5DD|nr:peroxisomal membrane protein 11B [Vespa velutina]XP_047360338.1 peroxisomal membrane protein 11B [Vespa velutina]
MDIIIKLNEQTAGRDKIIRLLQYGSRTCWYYAQNVKSTRQSSDVLRSLEYTFSSFRKLLRLGRCLDSLYSALLTMKCPDLIVRIILTLSKIANALFLLADHIIWVGRVGIFRVDIEKWNKVANKYWLMNIILNLVRDVYEIVKILEQEKFYSSKRFSMVSKCKSTINYDTLLYLKDHKDIVMDTIKNGCDLFIPLTALGYTKLTPGVIGICGLISSMVGIYTLVHPLYKLKPS